MEKNERPAAGVTDELIRALQNETETPPAGAARRLVEAVRRAGVSPQVAAIGEAMKEDIRMELYRRIAASQRRRFRLQAASVAAAVALLIGVTGHLSYRQGYRQVNAPIVELTNPLGMQSSIVLSDGTRVRLNAGTTLVYPTAFTANNREVTVSGEAYFEVSPDKRHPFTVHAENLDVRVLGTKFNVKAYPEETLVAVTLEDGQVEAGLDSRAAFHHMDVGEQLVFDKTRHTFRKSRVQTSLYTSWTEGAFHFESMTFEQIASQLERRFNVKIHIASDLLKQTIFTGDFIRKENLNQILHVMTVNRRIRYEVEGDQVYIR
ncbi:MAG: FecR domain-containing protein [Tannerella sp.]|nr:FecR domain-containing protein [Tannerella sp.]